MHYEPPDVTWPPPEPDAGAEDGELSPLDEELPDEELPDVLVPLDVPEDPEDPEEAEEARPVLFAVVPDDV